MIYVVTADDGTIEEYAQLTRVNVQSYCDSHDYRFVRVSPYGTEWNSEVSPAWNLVNAIQYAFDLAAEGDWIFLLGADAFVVNMEFDLEAFIEQYPEKDLLFTRDINGLNTNGILLRVCDWTRELVERWWDLRGRTFEVHTNGHVHQWEEQAALMILLGEDGAILNEDISIGDWSPMQDVRLHTAVLPQEVTNGYPSDIYGTYYKTPVFICYYPGKTTEERVRFISQSLAP